MSDPNDSLPDDFIHVAAREKVRKIFSARRSRALQLLAIWFGIFCAAWLLGTLLVGPMITHAAGLDAPMWRMRQVSPSMTANEPAVLIKPVKKHAAPQPEVKPAIVAKATDKSDSGDEDRPARHYRRMHHRLRHHIHHLSEDSDTSGDSAVHVLPPSEETDPPDRPHRHHSDADQGDDT